MNNGNAAIPTRLDELMADRALAGLGSADVGELATLLEASPGVDPESMERAAAVLAVGLAGPMAAVPPGLRRRLLDDAASWRRSTVDAPTAPREGLGGPSLFRAAWWGWVAAAACLVVAVLGWLPSPEATLTADDLLRLVADARTYAWGDNDLGVRGAIVWSNERQAGFIRLEGLPANDPSDHQYQLWIFDARRNEPFNAVDGGVFDVAGESVEIPIDAKLAVFEPTMFAITTEPPGGVVKHDPALDPERYKIVLTAKVG